MKSFVIINNNSNKYHLCMKFLKILANEHGLYIFSPFHKEHRCEFLLSTNIFCLRTSFLLKVSQILLFFLMASICNRLKSKCTIFSDNFLFFWKLFFCFN